MSNDKFPMDPHRLVGRDGRITISDGVRKTLGIEKGDHVDIIEVRKCLK